MMSKKMRDRFWLWGQDPGSHHMDGDNRYNLPGTNHMDSREGCAFFGISRCCRVAMGTGPFPPFDEEAEKIKDLDEVVWSAIGAGGVTRHNDDQSDLDEVLRMAEIYPNVTGAILDDFFVLPDTASQSARHSVASIASMRDRLHSFARRPLDLWMVWYSHQLDLDIQDYLDLADVITLWEWRGSGLAQQEEHLRTVLERTPGKRRLAGCYMWNYGESKPLTPDQMKGQLDTYHRWIREGHIEGIIFCSNCIADLGIEAVDYTRDWIAEVGDLEV